MKRGGDAAGADLALVAIEFREPLRLFVEEGKIPHSKVLMAGLVGDWPYAIKAAPGIDLSGVLYFLEAHCPDFAYGSVVAVVRWEAIGGLNGLRESAPPKLRESHVP